MRDAIIGFGAIGQALIPLPPARPTEVELKGSAQVGVTVRVEGPGQVVGMTANSSGNIVANVGVSMPGASQGSYSPGGY